MPPSHQNEFEIESLDRSGWVSMLSLLREHAKNNAAQDAIVDGEIRISYKDLVRQVERAARAFIATGIKKGDGVAIWAPNIYEWVIASLGLHACGGILIPLNTRFKGMEALDILRRSNARMLLTVRGFLGNDYPELLSQATGAASCVTPFPQMPNLSEIVILRGDVGGLCPWTEFLARADIGDPGALAAREAAVRPDDISDIMFTSGTTGHPKGAMHSHGQMLRAIAAVRPILGLDVADRYLIVPPFFHTFGYRFGFMVTLVAGATGVLQQALDVGELLMMVEREKITFLPGPPTVFYSLLNDPARKSFDLSSLRTTLLGAASVPVELIRELRHQLPFKTIITAYGLTETTGVGTICRPGDDDETIATTSGRPFPGTELKVVGENGEECPSGEAGEVWIRGFTVMKGYLDDPQQTAATITPEGWLRTGDIGIKDTKGNLRLVDRRKDVFIVGGFNAYPAEIENLMLNNTKIAQVAVVGAPDERLGEIGAAFIQLRPGQTATADEIIAWCRDNMANYKVPRIVEFVNSFPLNASGKVLKFDLRERAKSRAVSAVPSSKQ